MRERGGIVRENSVGVHPALWRALGGGAVVGRGGRTSMGGASRQELLGAFCTVAAFLADNCGGRAVDRGDVVEGESSTAACATLLVGPCGALIAEREVLQLGASALCGWREHQAVHKVSRRRHP